MSDSVNFNIGIEKPPEFSAEECRRDTPSLSRIKLKPTTSARVCLRRYKPFPLTSISSYLTTNTMLRFTVLATRQLGLGKPSATVTLRPFARNFTFGPKTTTNYLNTASNRSRVSPASFWSKCSRTFMTDSATVTTRPTQAEAWKRYAVTAVSPKSIPEGFRSI